MTSLTRTAVEFILILVTALTSSSPTTNPYDFNDMDNCHYHYYFNPDADNYTHSEDHWICHLDEDTNLYGEITQPGTDHGALAIWNDYTLIMLMIDDELYTDFTSRENDCWYAWFNYGDEVSRDDCYSLRDD